MRKVAHGTTIRGCRQPVDVRLSNITVLYSIVLLLVIVLNNFISFLVTLLFVLIYFLRN